MREYGQVQCAFWAHPKFKGADDATRLLALYLMTGPHSNGLGCMRVPSGYIQADLGWSPETVSKGFRDLIERVFIVRCDATEWVLLPDFLEWNQIANPKVAAARVKEAREVPATSAVWPAMVLSLHRHGRKHLPDDFVAILDEKWRPAAARIPEKTRAWVLDRDGRKCVECAATDDLTIDHIRPVAYGGTHAESNLRVLCRSCNSKWFPNGLDTVSKQNPTRSDPNKIQPEIDLVGASPSSSDENPHPTNGHDTGAEAPRGLASDSNGATRIKRDDIRAVFDFLNEQTGRTFQAAHPDGSLTKHGEWVRNLMRKGYDLQDFRIVIARKVNDWGEDDKMAQHLCPSTLFRPSNFANYRGQSEQREPGHA